MKRPINQSGVNAEQKAAAAALKIKLPADWRPTAKVSITEVPPDADQIVQQLIKDPARYARLLVKYSARQIDDAPYIQKGKKRAELETKTIAAANQKRQREAAAKHQEIRKIADGIIAENPQLRRATRYRLAKKIHEADRRFSVRTIQRALKK
jgi:hypothetical protein